MNIYAIPDPGGITLIDAGWSLTEAMDALERGLAQLGAGLPDVTSVLSTHFHPDHYTLAVELRRHTGCRITLGEDERPTLNSIIEGDHGAEAFHQALIRSGFPAGQLNSLDLPTTGAFTTTRAAGFGTVTGPRRVPASCRQWPPPGTPGATCASPTKMRACCSPAITCSRTSRRPSVSR